MEKNMAYHCLALIVPLAHCTILTWRPPTGVILSYSGHPGLVLNRRTYNTSKQSLTFPFGFKSLLRLRVRLLAHGSTIYL